MTEPGKARSRFSLDTNILVYSVDTKDPSRHRLAVEIVDHATAAECWLTLQAISEFYHAVSRKRLMPTDQAAALANSWLALFPHRAPSAAGVRAAIEHAVAGRASYWDALLLTTAAEAGCHLLFSEDMHHGAVLSGVEIHNPFAPGGGLTARARELLEL